MRGLKPEEYELLRIASGPRLGRFATLSEIETAVRLANFGRLHLGICRCGLGHLRPYLTAAGRAAMHLHEALIALGAL
jgi:hypothetical protein